MPAVAKLAVVVACAYCFGDPADPSAHGARWAVGILGGTTLAILGAIGWTVRGWARRAL